MKPVREMRAFSLIELLVAIAIMGIAAVGTYQLVSTLVVQQTQTEQAESAKIVLRSNLRQLEKHFGNSALIRPSEWLLAPNGEEYRGFAALTPDLVDVNQCQYARDDRGEQYSILRITRLVERFAPVRVLRKFYEADVGTGNPNRKLWVTYAPEDASEPYIIRENTAFAPEILIIDADTTDRRRYQVVSAQARPNASTPHTVLSIEMPRSASGLREPKGSGSFVTDSIVFGALTSIYCVNGSGSLVQVEEVSGKETVLVNPSAERLKISRFEVRYLGSKDAVPISRSTFALYPFGAPEAQRCLNTIKLIVDFQPLDEKLPPIHRESVILLNNTNFSRPAGCGT